MSSRELLQQMLRLWRIPVVGLLAASLAFGMSYLVSPTYESSARLLIRGRDATFLTQTGSSLANQPGVIDSTLAAALSETQSALLSTRAVATQVVDTLGLDQPREPEAGFVAGLRSFVGDLYRDAKSMVIHGFVADVDDRTRAIEGVYSGLSAAQIEGSYVIEVTALSDNPQLSAAIADTAADALVSLSGERFREEATAYRDFLAEQVEQSRVLADEAADAVRVYKAEHGIADLPFELELTASAMQTIRTDLEQATVELGEVDAELASVSASLSSTNRLDRSVQNIETGRSATSIVNESPNSVYQSLLASREQLKARRAAVAARHDALQELVSKGSVGELELSREEAELRQLEAGYSAAAATYQELNSQFQQAQLDSAADRVEVTRVDAATVPLYPIAPLRYLYLGLGFVIGAALGLALTVLTGRRRGWWGAGGSADDGLRPGRVPVIDLSAAEAADTHEPVPAGRTTIGRFEAFAAGPEERP